MFWTPVPHNLTLKSNMYEKRTQEYLKCSRLFLVKCQKFYAEKTQFNMIKNMQKYSLSGSLCQTWVLIFSKAHI